MKILAEPIAAPDPKGLVALGPDELGVKCVIILHEYEFI